MELIDYVTNTPQNTNKTILKQLVSSEKNKAVYESVEELKRDGGVGYTDEQPEPMYASVRIEIEAGATQAALSTKIAADSPFTTVGNRNLVIWDGKSYVCESFTLSDWGGSIFAGNASRYSPRYPNTGEPFLIRYAGSNRQYVSGEPGTHTLEIQNLVPIIHPIKKEYIPQEVEDNTVSKVMQELTDESKTKTIKVPMLERKDYIFSSIETNSQTEWVTGIDVSLPMFTIGNLNIVEFDGREYECETVARGGSGRYVGFGRSGLGDTSSEIPFSVRLDAKEGRMMVGCYTDTGYPEGTQLTHTFAVYKAETVNQIDSKYLPEGGFGYTETVKNFIAPEQTVPGDYSPNVGYCVSGITLSAPLVTPPEVVFFSLDGAAYACAKIEQESVVAYGNLSIFAEGFEDTGEPFLFIYSEEEVWQGYFKHEWDGQTYLCSHVVSAWTETETIHPISEKYLPSGGGLPVIDFGTLEAESENNFIAPVDPSLFKDYMCFVGKFTAGDDQGKSTVHMVFSCIDGIAWTGYIHTHPNFGNMEMFGIIMANGAASAMQITIVPGTQPSE